MATKLQELLAKQAAEKAGKASPAAPVSQQEAQSSLQLSVDPLAPAATNIPETKIMVNVPVAKDREVYFHCSHKVMTVLVGEKKIPFKNHFLITSDQEIIKAVREGYCTKKTGLVRFREVSANFFQSSQMIQPTIEALPEVPLEPPAENKVI